MLESGYIVSYVFLILNISTVVFIQGNSAVAESSTHARTHAHTQISIANRGWGGRWERQMGGELKTKALALLQFACLFHHSLRSENGQAKLNWLMDPTLVKKRRHKAAFRLEHIGLYIFASVRPVCTTGRATPVRAILVFALTLYVIAPTHPSLKYLET